MTRIAPLPKESATPEIRAVYDQVVKQYGRLLDPATVAANHLEIFKAYTKYEAWFAAAHRVDHKLKVLVTLIVASMIGCPFCIDLGSAEARSAGITEEQLRVLLAHADSSLFTAVERLALDYAVAMTSHPVSVPQSIFTQLTAILDSAQIIELTAVIAWENYRSRFNHALGITAPGFSDGAFCVLRNEGLATHGQSS
jgi:AhpD family alkylhydroperoxidase